MSGLLCAQCLREMTRRQVGRGNTHCSRSCRDKAIRAAPLPYDATLRKMAAVGDSWRCIAIACGLTETAVMRRAGCLGVAKQDAPSGPPSFTPEQFIVLQELYPQGAQFEQISAVVNAIPGGFTLRNERHLATWTKRTGVHRSAEYIGSLRRMKRKKLTVPVAVAPVVPERPPIEITLREVYARGFTMDLPRDKRGDLEALSRAVLLENPAHPGFVLADRQMSRVGLYGR